MSFDREKYKFETDMLTLGGVTTIARAARARAENIAALNSEYQQLDDYGTWSAFWYARRLAEATNAHCPKNEPAISPERLEASHTVDLKPQARRDIRRREFNSLVDALKTYADDAASRSYFSFFGRPYNDLSDFSRRAKSIYEAPFALSLLTIETFLKCLYHCLKAVYDFVACPDTAQAKADISQAADELKETMVIFSLAIASPFLNAADVVMGGVKEASDYCCTP
ncbi:MAG: hypothetical protein QNK11_04720 [Legionella sp.]|nr:hypothetical protein [Legionella sp.]